MELPFNPLQTPGTSTHVPTQQEQATAAAAAGQAAAATAAQQAAAQQQQQQQAADPAELICFFEEGEIASCDACGQRLKAPVRCNVLACPNCKHHVRATAQTPQTPFRDPHVISHLGAPPMRPPPMPVKEDGWLKRELFIKNINGREYIIDSHLFNIIYEPKRQPGWKHLYTGLIDEFISLYDQVGPMINIEEQQFILRHERLRDMRSLTIFGEENPEIKKIITENLLPLSSYRAAEIYLVYKDDGTVWDAYRMFYNVSYLYKKAFREMDLEQLSRMNEKMFDSPLGHATARLKSKKSKNPKKSKEPKKSKKPKKLKKKKKKSSKKNQK